MVQLVSLIHRIMPSWFSRHPSGQDATRNKTPLPREADAVWHGIVEQDTFGANTPDYAHVEDSDDRPRRHRRTKSQVTR